ncbi:MAG TPA: M56 family metallopeptidase [Pyrinomonadaceae bacterium]|jgi:TonB family protein
MSALHEILARYCAAFWPVFVDHLWQATLFALVVLALSLLLRRAPARVRYALWLIASAKFIIPAALFAWLLRQLNFSALTFPGSTPQANQGVEVFQRLAQPLSVMVSEDRTTIVTAGGAAHNELYCVLTGLWLIGCCALLAAWWWRRRELLGALKAGHSLDEGREHEALERARVRLGLKTGPALVLSPQRGEPGVWRTWHPVLVLPEEVADHLDDEELEAIMLHELGHVKRRDNLLGNLQMLLCAALWFHPLVWFINRRLLDEREQACDELVLGMCEGPGAYASGILKVVRLCFGWRVAGVAGVGNGSNLRRRIENIMSGKTNFISTARQRAIFGATLAIAFMFTVLMGISTYSRSALAQEKGSPKTGPVVITTRGSALTMRQDAEAGPAVREIMQAPEVALNFTNLNGAPLIINNATMRAVTREQLKRAANEEADFFDESLDNGADASMAKMTLANEYSTLSKIMLTNVTEKRVREIGIRFIVNGKTVVMVGYAEPFQPGEARSIESQWWRRNVILPNRPGEITIELAWVAFTDGSNWGGRPRDPHPPSPPPPPAGSSARSASLPAPDDEKEATKERRVVSAGGDGINGQALRLPQPRYPEIARAARAQGEVKVKVTLDEEGNVIAAEAISGHPLLQSAAVDAAREAQFRPTLLEGQPVKVVGVVSYVFALAPGNKEKEQ